MEKTDTKFKKNEDIQANTSSTQKCTDVKGVKRYFAYKEGDMFVTPKEFYKAYPDMEFKFIVNTFERVNKMTNMGWDIALIPNELKDRLRVRRTASGTKIEDTWIVGDQILVMRPKDECDEIRKNKELKYRKFSAAASTKLKKDIKEVTGQDTPVEVQEYKQ